jgi:hypothetical protein
MQIQDPYMACYGYIFCLVLINIRVCVAVHPPKIIFPHLLRLKEMCLRIAHVMTPTLASSTRTRTLLVTYYLVGQGLF